MKMLGNNMSWGEKYNKINEIIISNYFLVQLGGKKGDILAPKASHISLSAICTLFLISNIIRYFL